MTTFEIRNPNTKEECLVKIVNGQETIVPMSEANSDYQEYLETLANQQ